MNRRIYQNWQEVNHVRAANWNDIDPPVSKYEDFIDWCLDRGFEDIYELEDKAYDLSVPEDERHAAKRELDDLADDFLHGGFSEPDPSEETWDWSPRGW